MYRMYILFIFMAVFLQGCTRQDSNIDWSKEKTSVIKSAAVNGDEDAQYQLGYMYLNGRSVDKDYSQAQAWLNKAADSNNTRAQYLLAYMYFNGLGVIKSYEQALIWL